MRLPKRRARASLALAATILACVLAPVGATPSATPSVAWTRQFGSAADDFARDIDAASSSVFVTGNIGAGPYLFVRRYEPDGASTWTRTFGSSPGGRSLSIDASGGNVYAGGHYADSDGYDGFVRKYGADGALRWERVLDWSDDDVVAVVKATDDAIYVAGDTRGEIGNAPARGGTDGFLVRYSHAGARQWGVQLGTDAFDYVEGLAITSTGIIVAGNTFGRFAGQTSAGETDVFLRKYDFKGNAEWTYQFGTASYDKISGAVAAGNAIYVAGETGGQLGHQHVGVGDSFVRKVSADGEHQWTRQFGSEEWDSADDIEARAASIYVVGRTTGALPGGLHRGKVDAFVRRYTFTGGLVWTHQFGTPSVEWAGGVGANAKGVFIGGRTAGHLGAVPKGEGDAFVRRVVSYRPDAAISRNASFLYVGSDRYNQTAESQTTAWEAPRGTRRTFYVRVQNDGDTSDGVLVDGCGSGGGFGVRYYAGVEGDTEITKAVVDGTHRLSNLKPAQERILRMVITVRDSAAVGALKTCTVDVTSVARGLHDVVAARLTAEK